MQARYYDAASGRFISRDPEPFSPGNILSFNRFAYANNNPILNIDPNGRMAQVAVNGNQVTIRFPVVYTKGSSSLEQLAYNASIERIWSGKFGRYNVETHVVSTSPLLLPRSAYNVIDVGPMDPSVAGGRPYTNRVGGNYIKLANLPFPDNGSFGYLAWTAGHEAGHAMWLTDKYAGNGLVLPPYDTNIMGAPMQGPSEGDISTIINQYYAPELNDGGNSENIPSTMSGGSSPL